jgi:oligopeptide transport system ATP-binding protein
VGEAIVEAMAVHGLTPTGGRMARAASLLSRVGLDPAYVSRYPHEFSGGQRQRIGLARALALEPQLIVADEPVSALDVSVQVQILNLMKDLQSELRLSYLFVAHDLAVVRYMCDRILVMYLGRIVESGPAGECFSRPAHPYTKALLSAVPDIDRGLAGRAGRIVLKGDVPSAVDVPSGCRFHPRCPRAQTVCRTEPPAEREVAPGHLSACHFAAEVKAASAGETTCTAPGSGG